MRGIFISYRRDDSEGHAGRLFEDLSAHFGRDAVFMDVAGIKKGLDFRRIIDEAVASCGVLLVIIGKNWLGASDDKGQPRLSEPGDFVRLETAAALKRDIPVVPVLVQGAKMPREEDLPEGLKALAFRNGTELTHARWDSDVKLLIEDLKPYLDLSGAPPASVIMTPPPPVAEPAQKKIELAGNAVARRASWWAPVIAGLLVAVVSALGYVGWQEHVAAEEAARLAKEQAAAQAATARAADEQRLRDQTAAEKAAADRATADRLAREKAAADKAEAQRLATEKAEARAAAQAEADRRTRETAAAERAAATKAAAVAEADRLAREQAAADKTRAELLAATQAAVQAQADRRAREVAKAAADKAAADQAARDSAARAGTCLPGYVWREAGTNDRVCVKPDSRARAAADNLQAAARRESGGGAYGPNTCRQGYVWREAFPGDVVCVVPDVRRFTADENATAGTRVVRRSALPSGN